LTRFGLTSLGKKKYLHSPIAAFCRYSQTDDILYKKTAKVEVIRAYGIAHMAKNLTSMVSVSSPLNTD
ncbi:hypothetical protein, partial [Vibrio lentus]|uniref:hypothetical protein n=1 Tax=Vibrio lentus TaxID=136468 RepID=UPI0019D2F395